jgi:hypothetical protein
VEASENHGLTVASSITGSPGPWTNGGHQTHSGEANGHGVATTGDAGSPHFETSSADVVFGPGAAGTRGLGDSFHFKDEISGLGGSNLVAPADVAISHRENAAGSSGPHAISGEIQTIELPPPGQHPTDNFNMVPNHVGGGNAVALVSHDLLV